MKRLRFEHSARLDFSGNISEHCFTLRCLPFSDGRQLIREPRWEIAPAGNVWFSRDSFGNTLLCGRIPEPHDSFSFGVSGEVEIINACDIPGASAAIYGYESPLTKAGERIREFYANHTSDPKPETQRLLNFLTEGFGTTMPESAANIEDNSPENARKTALYHCSDKSAEQSPTKCRSKLRTNAGATL